jgi:hypothetical protein
MPDSRRGTRRSQPPGSWSRLRSQSELRFLPLRAAGEQRLRERKRPALSPRAALSSPSPGPRQPPPPLPEANKSLQTPAAAPAGSPATPRGAERPPQPPPSASYLWQRRRSPATVRSSYRTRDKQLGV